MRTERRDRPGKRTEPQRHHAIDSSRLTGDEWLYGRNAVNESLREGRRQVRRVLLLQRAGADPGLAWIEQHARKLGLAIERVERDVIDRIVPDVNHQGVAILATPYPYAGVDILDEIDHTVLALDHLVDPQNVGTLLRAAEAFGVKTILLPKDRAARITPAVVNSSAGAVEHLTIVQTVNLTRELDRLKKRGYWIVGIEQHERAQLLGSTPIPTPCVLVIGSEGQGMGPNLAKHCDLLLKIEMMGQVNSLNAAIAGSIALFEITRS